MKLLCSSGGICDIRYPGQGINDIKRAGFDAVANSFNGWGDHLSAKDLSSHIRNMSVAFNKNGIDVPVLYTSHLYADECVRIATEINAEYIVVEPFCSDNRQNDWKNNREFFINIGRKVLERKMNILLVNQCRDIHGHLVRGLCSDPDDAAYWVDELNQAIGADVFGFCMDIGTCNICGNDMHEFLQALGKRLKVVIISECDRVSQKKILPFVSPVNTNYLSLFRGLREIGFDGYFIMDMTDSAKAISAILRPDIVTMGRKIGEYFVWQIRIENTLRKYTKRVLFGAGNMCRNYMKCYGELYPPLFTCDNNSSRWGEQFAGLEIKPPDALKDLPTDCVIYICNTYYREIEKQLKDMGVTNPVEYFNDEYLPVLSVSNHWE